MEEEMEAASKSKIMWRTKRRRAPLLGRNDHESVLKSCYHNFSIITCLLLSSSVTYSFTTPSFTTRATPPPLIQNNPPMHRNHLLTTTTTTTTCHAHSTRSTETKKTSTRSSALKPPTNTKKVEKLITSLGRRGLTDDALALYNSHPPSLRTTRLMNIAIDACARARPPRVETAFSIFTSSVDNNSSSSSSSSPRLTPNVFTFGALTSVCARARDPDRAISILHTMSPQYHVSPNAIVYATVFSACERARPPRSHLALELLERAKKDGVEVNVVGYNTVISTLARVGDVEGAINILKEMERRGVGPDDVTYGTVMTACERSGRWRDVLSYAERPGLNLDGIMLTSALNACFNLGLAGEALKYLEMMKSSPQLEQQPHRKTRGRERLGARAPLVGPDDVAYCLAISACGRGGRYRDALRLLDEMKQVDVSGLDQPPSVNAYTAVISACAESGASDIALEVWKEMIAAGVRPTVVTYSAIIGACAKGAGAATATDYVSTALDIFQEMKRDETVTPNVITYNALMKVCGEGRRLDDAFEFMEELMRNGLKPTIVTFGTLMTACERVGSLRGVTNVFRLMKAQGVRPNEIVYGAAISCCRKAGEPQHAFNLLRKMLASSLTPNTATFNTVILSQTNSNNLAQAMTAFRLMANTTNTDNSDSQPDKQTFAILIRSLIQEQQPEKAEALLTYMTNKTDIVPDVYLYTATIQAYEKCGKPRMALRMMERMREGGYDFYENKVLNEAFKKIVTLVNLLVKKEKDEEESMTTRW